MSIESTVALIVKGIWRRMNCQRCNRPMANRYKAKNYNHAFVCSVCQFLNKYTAIRYMLRLRIADRSNDSCDEVAWHGATVIANRSDSLLDEYVAIARRLKR